MQTARSSSWHNQVVIWNKTKTKVRGAVKDSQRAGGAVRLRQRAKAISIKADTVWQSEFEEMFPLKRRRTVELLNRQEDMESKRLWTV